MKDSRRDREHRDKDRDYRRSRDDYHSRDKDRHRHRSSSRSRSSKSHRSGSHSKSVKPKDIDLSDSQVQKALETIEEDTFVTRTFYSTRDREAPAKKTISDKVIINLDSETVTLPKPPEVKPGEGEEIFHEHFLGDSELRSEKWIRKLFNFRQKCFNE